ncbi:MAG: oligosaccharide flippase family protein [Clostridia bacterium]|nr:oligosaccharide flippase family protein [Clostridia bacterium]
MAKLSLSSNKKTLLINTVMLYIMQFSTTLLGLIVIPMQTNVLGKDYYGTYIEASVAIVLYFRMVIDFGFLQSATEKISRKREDKGEISNILTSVVISKLFLIAASFGVMLLLINLIPAWESKATMLILYFFAEACASMTPDFLYRGLEKMSAITYRTVAIRVVFTLAIFFFFKDTADAWMVPGFTLIGNAVAMLVAYIHVKVKLGIGFVTPKLKQVVSEFTQSIQFFFSRFATTAYTSLNIILLDIITKGGPATSFYGSSNRLITAGRNALMPISDSMYPYMAKHKDFKLVKKMLLLFEPIIFVGCVVIYIIAIPFCKWFFGPEFGEAGHVLRAMLPLAIITLPNYILGFPTMTAMGKTKHANYSTIIGSVFHICLLGVLWLTGNMTEGKALLSLAWSVSATETVILGYRLIIIYKFRHLMRGGESPQP